MAESDLRTPPQQEQIEVSLFGPGYGECVLLHMGFGDWVVIDSCIDPRRGIPAALVYFDSISVDPSSAVRFVVASHWHDDHVSGISEVLSRCSRAKFVCPAVVQTREFMTLAIASGNRPMMSGPGVEEFAKVLATLESRRKDQTREKVSNGEPIWASQDKDLWLEEIPSKEKRIFRQLRALSPSDAAFSASLEEISRLLPQAGTTFRSVVARRPNNAAVAILARVGHTEILLAADLEKERKPGTGWTAVLDSPGRTAFRASAFKVPHHGSAGADDDRVWEELLHNEPYALLTPYALGRYTLPTRSDAARICDKTKSAYITAAPMFKKPKYGHTVNRTILETVRSIHEVLGPFGHIRLRRNADLPADSEWQVELFGSAMPLSTLMRSM